MRSPSKRALVALAATIHWTAGCSHPWPTVTPLADRSFQSGQRRVATVDVLPLDVELASDTVPAETMSAPFGQAAYSAIWQTLARRGYRVVAMMDWAGGYHVPQGEVAVAMTQDDVVHTADAMSSYCLAQARVPVALLDPQLPARLGVATGSDATLYIGGFAYAGTDEPQESAAGKVVKVLAIGVVVLTVVFIVAALLKKGGGSGGGARVPRGAAGSSRSLVRAGRAGKLPIGHGHRPVGVGVGVSEIHLDVGSPRYVQPMPEGGSPSMMNIRMTLVDNKTGQALWHASQQFPASPARQGDIAAVMADMLMTLPAQRHGPRVQQ